MALSITVPTLGESVPDATVGRWLKNPGDTVRVGEPVVELETDKVNLEVPAPADGTLGPWNKEIGDTVAPGDVLAEVAPMGLSNPAVPPPDVEWPRAAAATPPGETRHPEPQRATPSVRRLAEASGVALATVHGSGPAGRVLRQDVVEAAAHDADTTQPGETAAATPAAPIPPHPTGTEERMRLSRRRLTIARRLVEAQRQAAILTTFNEIDMTSLIDLRRRHRDAFAERHGVRLGYMSLFTRAAVAALKAFPEVNSELQGDELVLKRYYHIGIAMASPEGLVVPVIRDADRKTLAEMERDIDRLRKRQEGGALTLADLADGTFTITNGGVFGSLLSTPILNQPQVAILGMHTVQERPVARDGQVVIHPMMYVALSYDHRVIDGSVSVRFLALIKSLLEDPERLLLDA